ncbi:MAG: phospholipase A [Pseudomonadales bacterium]|nr:phospholipase A [Pseudomonadales bacterium]
MRRFSAASATSLCFTCLKAATVLLALTIHVLPTLAAAATAEDAEIESCWLEQLRQSANDSLTVKELKNHCRLQQAPVSESVDAALPDVLGMGPSPTVERARFNAFFEPYKETYLLAGAMRNADGSDPFSGRTADIKFKLGLKFRLFPDLPALESLAPLYFGYSQQSWWDVAESSAPFREHNYNPEIFWDYSKTSNLNGLNFIGRLIDRVGYEHQSNGQDGSTSRSWDRVYVQRQFQAFDRLSLGVKAWEVVNKGEENSDITDYLGNLQLQTAFQANDRLTVRASALQGWETSKLSFQLDLIYRIPEWVNSQFMLSYYEGYGEALISYRQKTSSLRAGLYFPISFNGIRPN